MSDDEYERIQMRDIHDWRPYHWIDGIGVAMHVEVCAELGFVAHKSAAIETTRIIFNMIESF